jgi:hypothetical protein
MRREYFSINIYNKANLNISGAGPVSDLLSDYVPRYHISSPTYDYSPNGGVHYNVISTIRNAAYLIDKTITYNITLQKDFIIYDTAVNPRNERPTAISYELDATTSN